MRYDTEKKPKLPWTKFLARKWFNLKSKPEGFQPEFDLDNSGGDEGFSNWSADRESCRFSKSKTDRKRSSDRLRLGKDQDAAYSKITNVDNYRIFVSTWNVAGKSPPSDLSLDNWLHTSPPADIYVLGFQEIVPLNAGNVLGIEDNVPAQKWLSLIGKTLNTIPDNCDSSRTPSPSPGPVVELEPDSTRGSSAPHLHRRSFHSLSRTTSLRADTGIPMLRRPLDRRFSVCDRVLSGYRNDDSSDDEYGTPGSPNTTHCSPLSYGRSASLERSEMLSENSRYCLVADKQMVGIFLTVWVRRELQNEVSNLNISCVGRGLMGYLGNKGSISISMKLHQTSFCFVCSHLSSGQKEGDELRRNSDVMEILRKTKFPKVSVKGFEVSPQTILDHDRVIWLGDLNYRIALSYGCTKALLEMHNWRALLDRDQLRVERRQGRVFQGWKEGRIYFAPTYKYSRNSDQYAGDVVQCKEKRRTPAWCDRILWYGQGLRQLSYVRVESRFSDHRPVTSIFLAKVESINHNLINKSSNYMSSKVEVEELLAHQGKHRKNQGFH